MKTQANDTRDEGKQKHTPTPWKVITGENTSYPDNFYIQGIGKHGFKSVLAIMNDDGKDDKRHGVDHDRKANAAFIVKAVNSHEALVEACKQAYYYITNPTEHNRRSMNGEIPMLGTLLREALKLAE